MLIEKLLSHQFGSPCQGFQFNSSIGRLLFAIASLFGTPLRLDDATAMLKCPSMAKIQVEIDVLKPLPQKVWIGMGSMNGFWQKIEAEKIPKYCTHCWHLGHQNSDCYITELKNSAKNKDVDSAKNPINSGKSKETSDNQTSRMVYRPKVRVSTDDVVDKSPSEPGSSAPKPSNPQDSVQSPKSIDNGPETSAPVIETNSCNTTHFLGVPVLNKALAPAEIISPLIPMDSDNNKTPSIPTKSSDTDILAPMESSVLALTPMRTNVTDTLAPVLNSDHETPAFIDTIVPLQPTDAEISSQHPDMAPGKDLDQSSKNDPVLPISSKCFDNSVTTTSYQISSCADPPITLIELDNISQEVKNSLPEDSALKKINLDDLPTIENASDVPPKTGPRSRKFKSVQDIMATNPTATKLQNRHCTPLLEPDKPPSTSHK